MTFSDDSVGSERRSLWSYSRRRYFQKRFLLHCISAALLHFILLRFLFMSQIAFPSQSAAAVRSPPISSAPEENVSHGQFPIIFASSRAPTPGPDDNGREELQFEALKMAAKDENTTEEDMTAAEENSSQEKPQEEEKQVFVNEENAQQEKLPEEGENINDEEEIQTEDNRNSEGLREPADEQRGAEERQSNEEKAAQDREEETRRNAEEEEREREAGTEREAEKPRNLKEEERSHITEHNIGDVALESNFEEEPKGGGDQQEQAERKGAEEVSLSEGTIQVEEQQLEPERMKPPGEQQEPVEQVEEEDKQRQDTGQTDEETPAGECDLFDGEWEHDPEGPLYTNSTCFYMQEAQNCMSNGRPDTKYMYWRWKPWGCDLPRFDAKAFLDKFRGKAIGFIGDSIARNQMQSLLCMLSQVEIPMMTYESVDDKTVRWFYKEHQVTLGVVWSPYLLKESEEGDMGFEKGQSLLYLDVLDTAWTSVMQDFDIIVFLTGQWYYKGSVYIKQEKVIGCHCCPGLNLTNIGFHQAYGGAIRQVLEKVSNEYKGIAIMSTFPLSHFEDGTWDTGGHCNREMPLEPLESAKFPGLEMDYKMHDIVIEEFNGVVKENREVNKEAYLEILDVTKVSLQRADGHPGPFRRPHPEEGRDPNRYYPNDCLHWCLPGPIEAWNQLVVKIVDKYLSVGPQWNPISSTLREQ